MLNREMKQASIIISLEPQRSSINGRLIMFKRAFILLLLFLLHYTVQGQRYWIASTSSNWNNTANWSETSGGAGGASVPVAGVAAVFNSGGTGNCTLDIAPTIGTITITGYTGTINLNGNNLTISGSTALTFSSGTISNSGATAAVALNTTGAATFDGCTITANISGTAGSVTFNGGSTFGGTVNLSAPTILLNGTTSSKNTFNNTTTLTKTGSTTDLGTGANIFNSVTTLINSGTGTFESANNYADTFNGDVTLTNTSTSRIHMADGTTGTVFNGNIIVNSTGSGTTSGVRFGFNSGTSASLAEGKTITAGTFTAGTLYLCRFTQGTSVGTTTQTLTLTGTAILNLGPSSTFNGNVTFKAPQVYLNGCTYNGTAYVQKNGASNNLGDGGNVFNGITTLVNSGTGYFATAFISPDIFNADLTATNTGTSWVALSDNAIGTKFNGNIIVNSTNGTANAGVTFGNGPSSTMTCTLASGKTITVGTGFTAGRLRFRGFIQSGATPQTLTLTGTAQLFVGNLSTFNGDVTFKAPQLYLDGCTYNGTAYLEKTGATNNLATLGSNIFNSTATIINSGSGYLRTNGNNVFNSTTAITSSGNADVLLEQTTASTYNGNVTFTNSGSSRIWVAYNGANAFNGNIIVNSTAGSGITFCGSTGTATLANTKTITVGSLGFSIGTLTLQRFTQTGSTSQAMSFTGTGNLTIGPSSTFNGNVTFKAPQLYLNGCTHNSTAYLEKTGASDNLGTGGNTFASTTSIVNSGSGYLRTSGNNTFNGPTTITNSSTGDIALEMTNGGIYNGDVTYSNTGSAGSILYAAYNGSTSFNGNILVNNTGGIGINFCGSTLALATLASGKTITTGVTGFSTGTLNLQRFTQTGTTGQFLTLTGAAALIVGPSATFNGNATFSAPQVYLNGGIYNSDASITKYGATANNCTGGNTFNGITSLTNSSSAQWRLAGTTADTYNAAISFSQASSGVLQPAYAGTNSFYSDITINSPSAVTFGGGTGIVELAGSNNQTITSANSIPVIQQLFVNKTSGTNTVTLNSPVSIGSAATLTNGIINTTSANYLNFNAGSSVSGASSASYVDGPVRKTGSTAFDFPTGNNSIYRPIAMSAPNVAADAFTAQYFNAAQPYGDEVTFASPLYTVSACEYWTLDRTIGTSDVAVTLGWNSADCPQDAYVTDPSSLVVARWDGSAWVSHGNGGTTGNAATGTVSSSAAITSFSPFALGTTSPVNPLPVEWLSFACSKTSTGTVKLTWITASESNSDYFSIEKSKDGLSFQSIGKTKASGTTNNTNRYIYEDSSINSGRAYYRLKQVDLDGKFEYSEVCYVNSPVEEYTLKIYPNPGSNTVYIDLDGEEALSFSVLNNLGQKLSVPSYDGDAKKVLDTSNLTAGFYIIEVTIDRKVFKEKIMIQR
jgi:hypothetical protein